MDSLFYNDFEYHSSLLQSPIAKKNLYATLNKTAGRDDKQRNVNENGRNNNFEMKSTLMNSNHIKYDDYYSPTTIQYQYNHMDHKVSCFNRIIHPCAAEFVAVFLCIFIGKVMESELSVHIISSNTERIILQALTDSVIMLVMVMAFKTVHLNPVITLAEFFALTTAWPMCCAMIIMQILASVIAVAAFSAFRSGNSELQMPIITPDITIDRVDATYHLILSQFIGTLLVVITHLLITTRIGSGLTALARPGDSPLSVAAAVFVSSLLCLLNSTIGWNPLLAFALAIYGSIECDFAPLQMQAVFWIGPCLASLFACFLYRLLFATKESHLMKCSTRGENDHL
ncbi:Aquaporin-1 [Dirofilaria immitis]|nr:Aquaporin-1 [Dirofilaria immitis]